MEGGFSNTSYIPKTENNGNALITVHFRKGWFSQLYQGVGQCHLYMYCTYIRSPNFDFIVSVDDLANKNISIFGRWLTFPWKIGYVLHTPLLCLYESMSEARWRKYVSVNWVTIHSCNDLTSVPSHRLTQCRINPRETTQVKFIWVFGRFMLFLKFLLTKCISKQCLWDISNLAWAASSWKRKQVHHNTAPSRKKWNICAGRNLEADVN